MTFEANTESINGVSIIVPRDVVITAGNQGNYNGKVLVCTAALTITLARGIMASFRIEVRPPESGTVTVQAAADVFLNATLGASATVSGTGTFMEVAYTSHNRFTGAVTGGGGGGGASTQTAYSTSVPLDGNKYMPDVTVTATPDFVAAAGFVAGANCRAGLISDGVAGHIPTFSGFLRDPASDNFTVTLNRLHNVFFYNDGLRNWYLLKDTGLAIAAVASALDFSVKPTSALVGAPLVYTVRSNGILATGINVTISDNGGGGSFDATTKALASGTNTTVSFTYTPGSAGSKSLSTTNTGGLANPTPAALTVVVPAATTVVRQQNVTGLTESGDGTAGYTYTRNGTGTSISTQKIAAATDGFFQYAYQSHGATQVGIVGSLKATQVAAAFTTGIIGVYPSDDAAPGTYRMVVGATGNLSGLTTVGFVPNDVIRIGRRNSSTSAIGYVAISKDGGATFTDFYVSAAGFSAADLWLQLSPQGAAGVVGPLQGGSVV